MQNEKRTMYAVAGAAVLMFAGLIYAWSVLSLPIERDYPEWTKAQLSLTFTIIMIMFCVGQVLCGILLKHIRPGNIIRAAGILFLAGFLGTASAASLPVLYYCFGVFCGLAAGIAYNCVMSTVSVWFPESPGLISGILLMGFGMGSFLIGKVFQAVTPAEYGGWRVTMRFLGILILIVFWICAVWIRTNTELEISSRTCSPEEKSVAPAEMAVMPSFWIFYLWAIVMSAAGFCVISQAAGMVKETILAVSGGTVATIAGLISIFNGIGRVVNGGLYDRIGKGRTLSLIVGVLMSATLILTLAMWFHSSFLIILGFCVTGYGCSGAPLCTAAFVSTEYGRKHFSNNLPLMNTNMLFSSFGSTAAGMLLDKTGAFSSVFVLMLLLEVIGLVCVIGLQRQKR